MARLETTAHTCDRHGDGSVLATVTRSFSIDGRRYRVDLCKEHDRLLTLNLGPWVNCAEEETLGHVGLSAEEVAPVRPSPLIVMQQRTEIVEDEPEITPAPVPVPRDTSGVDREVAREWRITDKARARMDEQHLGPVDVWRILSCPATDKPGMFSDTRVYSSPDGIELVVNPSTKTVITVFVPHSLRRISA